MARTVAATVDILLERIRQAGGVAVTTNFATVIVSHCQRIVNAGTRKVVGSASLTISANTIVYAYRASLTSAVDVLTVKEGTRLLQKCTSLADFAAYDATWIDAVGTRFEAWMQIGRDILIVWPAKTGSSSVTVSYSKLTAAYTNYTNDGATNLDLPDEDVDYALNLAELILLIRGRQFDVFNRRVKELFG